MQEQALKIASHITHPVTVAAFAAVLAATALVLALRAKKPRIAWVLALGIIILGLAPLSASTYLQSRGIYHVRVAVWVGESLVPDANVISLNGGEPKKIDGGWEFDIPPQSRPADGMLKLFASEKNSFLAGSSTLVLDKDYFPPTVEIQLDRDTSAIVRGVVIDEHNRSVAGAHVSIPGYPDVAITDEMGNFVLPAHAANGQIVRLRAQKDQLTADVSVPAGNTPVELTLK